MFKMSKRQLIVFSSALFCALGAGGLMIWQGYQSGQFSADSTTTPKCTIDSTNYTSGMAIPDACDENSDVVINGLGVTSMMVTTSGARTFKSLTLENGAVLTHQALAETDIASATNLKRVDLTILGKLTISTNAKIDVTGRGYKGASVTVQNCNTEEGVIYAQSYNNNSYGWGPIINIAPSGGAAFYNNVLRQSIIFTGGGGGFGGDGQLPNKVSTGGKSYPIGIFGWEYGAGGGSETAFDGSAGRNVQAYSGGNGGGAVIIKADSVIIDATSKIQANGDKAPSPQCSDSISVGGGVDGGGMSLGTGGGGGGAGGYIGIQTNSFNKIPTSGTDSGTLGTAASAVAGGTANGGAGSPGVVLAAPDVKSALASYLSAAGGTGTDRGGGGGGGRITIATYNKPAQPTVSATINGGTGPITVAPGAVLSLAWTATPAVATDTATCSATGPDGTVLGTASPISTNASTSVGDGTYTISCKSTAGGVDSTPVVTTFTVTVSSTATTGPTTLSATLTVTPASGPAPLTGVTLTATATNIATGTINYTFYCDRNTQDNDISNTGFSNKVNNSNLSTVSAGGTCSYPVAGTYYPKVIVENANQPSVFAIVPVTVTAGTATTAANSPTPSAVTFTHTVAVKNGYFSNGNADWGIDGKPYDSAYATGSCSKKDPCFRMQRNQLFAANDSARSIWQDIGALNQGKSYDISLWYKHAIWFNSTGRLQLIDTTANQVVVDIDISGSNRTWINKSASFTPNDSNYSHNYQVKVTSDNGFRRWTGLLVDDITIKEN